MSRRWPRGRWVVKPPRGRWVVVGRYLVMVTRIGRWRFEPGVKVPGRCHTHWALKSRVRLGFISWVRRSRLLVRSLSHIQVRDLLGVLCGRVIVAALCWERSLLRRARPAEEHAGDDIEFRRDVACWLLEALDRPLLDVLVVVGVCPLSFDKYERRDDHDNAQKADGESNDECDAFVRVARSSRSLTVDIGGGRGQRRSSQDLRGRAVPFGAADTYNPRPGVQGYEERAGSHSDFQE